MNKHVSLLLRTAIVAACLAYVAWGVDLTRMWQAFSAFSPLAVALVVIYQFLAYVPPALRLVFLTRGDAGLAASYMAFALGLGVNNLLPAKLGELAKVAYLRQAAGVPMPRGFSLVFLERFFDLNAALLMALAASWVLGGLAGAVPVALVVGGLWCFLLLHRVRPGLASWVLKLLPVQRVRDLAQEVLDHLGGTLRAGFLLRLGLITLLVWSLHISTLALLANWVAGLHLSPGQIVAAFALATLGMAVPSTPGGLGVFEAALMLGLELVGVPKETALALGLAMRLCQYLPSLALTMLVLANTDFSLKQLRSLKVPAAGLEN